MRNLFRYLGLRHLTEKPVRSLLTTVGVALGIALFIAIQIINRSTLHSFEETIQAVAGKAKLTVSAGDAGFPEEKLDIVKNFPGVKNAVPMVESHGFIVRQGSAESLVFLGVDLLKEQAVRTYKIMGQDGIEDPLTFLNQADSVILSRDFAQAHGLEIDSKFSVSTATGKKSLTVRGLMTPEGTAKAYGGALAIMDIDGARMTFGKENKLDRIDLVTTAGADIDKLAVDLEHALGPGYKVQRPEGQQEEMEHMVSSYQVMLSFFSTLALLVGLFLVTNSVQISVAERRREIGTLRSLGATKGAILGLFLTEAVAMGVVGSSLGVLLGRLLATSLIDMVSKSMSNQYLTVINPSKIIFDSYQIFKGVGLGASAAILAALLPAWRASTIQPLEAMKKTEISAQGDGYNLFGISFKFGFFCLAFYTLSSALSWPAKIHAIEHVNSFFGLVGPALVAPTLVYLMLRLARKLQGKSLSAVARLSEDNLARNFKRTSSNVMTLMVGLVLVILLAATNSSFRLSILGWFDHVVHQDILISSFGRMISYQVQPVKEELAREIEKIPGVLITDGVGAYGVRFIHVNYEGKQLGLKSFDKTSPNDRQITFEVVDRSSEKATEDLFNSKDPTIMVSQNFVQHFAKKSGDTVTLDTPTGPVSFRIVGIAVDYASPEGILYMDRGWYKKFWKDSLVNAFGVRVKQGYKTAAVRKEMDRQLGEKFNLMTLSTADLRGELVKSIEESFAYTRAIELSAFLVAILGLLNTFLISTLERARELGVLRAVGMTGGQLMSMLLQEALWQGVLGALVAVALGSYIAWLWINQSLSRVLGWIIHFHFPASAIIETLTLGTLVTLAAAWYPAWRASRLQIKDALEYE